jgi:hypothetical protein
MTSRFWNTGRNSFQSVLLFSVQARRKDTQNYNFVCISLINQPTYQLTKPTEQDEAKKQFDRQVEAPIRGFLLRNFMDINMNLRTQSTGGWKLLQVPQILLLAH